MATTYGAQPEDIVTDRGGNVLEGVTLELYETRSDATSQISRIAQVVTDSLGSWTYSDPASRSVLYLRDPNGRVWALEAEEASSGTPITGLAGLPAGSTFTIYWDGSAWTYAGDTIVARPSARADLTMIAVGGTTGPAFGQVGVDLWLRDA